MKVLVLTMAAVVALGGSALAKGCGRGTVPSYPTMCLLEESYNPNQYTGGGTGGGDVYTPPKCSDLPVETKTILRDALDAAGPELKADLCRLSAIFVKSGESWGVWENPSDQGLANYIFIQETILSSNLTDVEREMQQRVVGLNANVAFTTDSNTNTPIHALISVMAHELGHVKYYRDSVAETECFENKIKNTSWEGGKPTRRWVEFGAPSPDNNRKANIPNPQQGNPSEVVNTLSHFVTPFAGVSPEEDFVETYRLMALQQAGVNNLSAVVSATGSSPSSPPAFNLIRRLSLIPKLSNKVNCIRDNLL